MPIGLGGGDRAHRHGALLRGVSLFPQRGLVWGGGGDGRHAISILPQVTPQAFVVRPLQIRQAPVAGPIRNLREDAASRNLVKP